MAQGENQRQNEILARGRESKNTPKGRVWSGDVFRLVIAWLLISHGLDLLAAVSTVTAEPFSTSESMREKRRMGVGASAAGRSGLAGMDLELDFQSKWGLVVSSG